MLKMSKISILNADKNKDFYEEKINTAKYFFDKITPRPIVIIIQLLAVATA